jgi:demethylmenaquinone methyltransferase/2-methoxy-6-polyprenyl-1,4-benzoquinol methylase
MAPTDNGRRKTTDFGFREVAEDAKAGLVGEVFTSVADKYDLMNDVMSFGVHRLWKRFAVSQAGVRAGSRVLDVAGGSGDLGVQFARRAGARGRVVTTDINAAMLARGRNRFTDEGMVANVDFVQADAECLPFANNHFDCVSIAFGLRNVTHKDKALASMYRVLKPGGRLIVLEFSQPLSPGLSKLYDAYSFNVVPMMGRLIAHDEASYRYLVESIRKHPDQPQLKALMEQAGFERVHYFNLSGGIVALHKGYKF